MAFDVFTRETDPWWRRGLAYRVGGRRPGSLCFEEGVGGRLFEPAAGGTRVTVRHRGWASLRPGHPARRGLEGAPFSRMIGLWWGDLMTALREHVEKRG